MSDLRRSTTEKRVDDTTTITVRGRAYHVHAEQVGAGWQGYVIRNGVFFCTLPYRDTKQQLLDVAQTRISELQ